MQHCRAATGHHTGEPTWLKLAQGLLLSPPSLYGDRSTIGHDYEGRELTEPSFWVWRSGFDTLCWIVFYLI